MKRGWVVLTILWAWLPAAATAQRRAAPSGNTEPKGTIEVLAYSTLGVFLGSSEIHFFGESFENRRPWVAAVHTCTLHRNCSAGKEKIF